MHADLHSETVIVGGGCSGVLTAANLARVGVPGQVAIIEPRATLGRGLAYSTTFEGHLLNVPARNMSVFPDRPNDFLDWLREREWPGAHPGAFAPRALYGEYLENTLEAELKKARRESDFTHLRTEIVSIAFHNGLAHLTTSDSRNIAARRVVLALGNPASSAAGLPVAPPDCQDRWHASPWSGDALQLRHAGERILLLGTGLTAIDSALTLLGQDPGCQVFMASRRGVMPQAHVPPSTAGAPERPEDWANLRHLVREMRMRLKTSREAGECWRNTIDGLRPVSNQFWDRLSVSDRRRFLRHLKPYWESHRHRMAPEIHRQIEEYRKLGTLTSMAGRLVGVNSHPPAIKVRILLRGGSERSLVVDRIIHCGGIEEHYATSRRPLIRMLIATGLAAPNAIGSGFQCAEHGALLDATGEASRVLFTLGPPRRGELFETTAVPEIRAQAADLARHLSNLSLSDAAAGS